MKRAQPALQDLDQRISSRPAPGTSFDAMDLASLAQVVLAGSRPTQPLPTQLSAALAVGVPIVTVAATSARATSVRRTIFNIRPSLLSTVRALLYHIGQGLVIHKRDIIE